MRSRMSQWIEDWPWTKTFTALAVLGFALTLLLTGFLVVLILLVPKLQPQPSQAWLVAQMRDIFNDAMQWTVLAATGGVIGLVGKRATTKPEVIRAETEAKKVDVAAGQASVLRVAERYGDES